MPGPAMVGPPFTPPLALIPAPPPMYAAQQQHAVWDQHSLANSFNTMMLQTSPSLTEWVTDSAASNHNMPDLGNISLFRPPNPTIPLSIIVGTRSSLFRPPNPVVPSSIVVGNRFILPVTSVGNTVLLGLFYLNNILVTPDIIKNLLSIHQLTTDNWHSMEFDPFGLFVMDFASRNMIIKCNSFRLLYTIGLPATHPPQAFTY
jgi:hypothetical protein